MLKIVERDVKPGEGSCTFSVVDMEVDRGRKLNDIIRDVTMMRLG